MLNYPELNWLDNLTSPSGQMERLQTRTLIIINVIFIITILHLNIRDQILSNKFQSLTFCSQVLLNIFLNNNFTKLVNSLHKCFLGLCHTLLYYKSRVHNRNYCAKSKFLRKTCCWQLTKIDSLSTESKKFFDFAALKWLLYVTKSST